MLEQFLTILLTFFVAYVSSYYTLATFWESKAGKIVVAAVFAVLCVMFVNPL